jgi:hypothetical protein
VTVDVSAAVAFTSTHGRVLDRRRLHHLLDGGGGAGVLAALDAYRNDDGGYGWALEPDLRTPESQPGAALHAFEAIVEIAPKATPRSVELCQWLMRHTIKGQGLPFALAIGEPGSCAPWWQDPDTTTPSLHMSTAVAAAAHRVARADPAVATHAWLITTTRWCLDRIQALSDASSHELLFSLQFLDASCDRWPEADALIDRLARWIPVNGIVPVTGGIDGEVFYPLDFAPHPGGAARRVFEAGIIANDLERLAAGQQRDGGWSVNFRPPSPAGRLEWRAHATVTALAVLRANAAL